MQVIVQRGPRPHVALRKESVDRNNSTGGRSTCAAVALRKESVDRNRYLGIEACPLDWSLSARRAWIEILSSLVRNMAMTSLSARRAWIEILNFLFLGLLDNRRSPQGERG